MRSFIFIFTMLFLVSNSAQAASQRICYNATTKAISVATRCPKGTAQINGTNIKSLLGSTGGSSSDSEQGIDYTKCYKQTGSEDGSASDGRVGVAVSCKSKTDVMIASGFSTVDNTQSFPALSSQTILLNKLVPNGIQLETTGKQNQFYSLSVTITCCPQLS